MGALPNVPRHSYWMNKTLNVVTGDNSDAVIDLRYEKKILRVCIYLLFPLYLRNLLFPWLLMKMLLAIFLKIPLNVIEVMVVLMLLLFALKLVRSGVHHTRGEGHDIVCTSPSPLIEPPTKFFEGGLDQISTFRGGLLGKRGWPFQEGLQFLSKK